MKATVAGLTADVTVKQTYSNPYDRVIEATYVFPLPENAAVTSVFPFMRERWNTAQVR